jgi:alkanesulfonate monooxygenase SsuD/methylene tetrahydromethanopterin reductase-like flavin-dependent oxidoreductase (luciferase family)
MLSATCRERPSEATSQSRGGRGLSLANRPELEMRIGVTLPFSESDGYERMPTWNEVAAYARHAEAIGLDSVWGCDHFFAHPPGRSIEGTHEGWTIISAVAAITRRVEVGQMVMCIPFRNPGLLAKMTVTADEVSGGRLVLGIGAGWHKPEFQAFGYPTDHLVDRFEQGLKIIHSLLDGQTVTTVGKYHRLDQAVLLPPPTRPIPLLVAGRGLRMLALTARYANAWNSAWHEWPDDRLRQRMTALDAALATEQRDPRSLRRTVNLLVQVRGAPHSLGSVDRLALTIDAFARLDIDDLIIGFDSKTRSSLDLLSTALQHSDLDRVRRT